jgi:1,4-dihydroxy-2-naphthoate octaprenyltransferase
MAYESGGFHLLSALAALFGALMIQIGTNYANDYFDHKKGVDTDHRLGPTRATQAGWVTPAAMKRATIVAFSLAFLAGIYLVWRGGWPIVVIGLLSILFGILYTGGPVPIGYVGLGDLFVLIFFGPVAVGGTYYVQTLSIHTDVVLMGIAAGLFSTAILTVNNLRDIESDRAAGRKTLAVRFGGSFSKWEYLISIIIASLIPLLLYAMKHRHIFSAFAVLVLVAAIPAVKKVFSHKGAVLNDVLAATGRLLLIFSLIFSVGWLL